MASNTCVLDCWNTRNLRGAQSSGISMESHGVCSKCGIILNPFGQKPEWVLVKAEKLRNRNCLNNMEEALV